MPGVPEASGPRLGAQAAPPTPEVPTVGRVAVPAVADRAAGRAAVAAQPWDVTRYGRASRPHAVAALAQAESR